MPMTLEAPGHAVRLGVINHRHVIDLAVTTRAADARDSRGLRDCKKRNRACDAAAPIRSVCRFSSCPAPAEASGYPFAPAYGSSCRSACSADWNAPPLDEAVAITAIHSELRHVDVVRKRHWLNRLVADPGVFWRRVIPGGGG